MPHISKEDAQDCRSLNFTTSLTGPIASVVINLSIGEKLHVDLVSPSSLQVLNANGVLVGSLLTHQRDNMIECMRKGNLFVATVIKINGGHCEVRVTCS